jgi:class 3 adenylate cyclase
VIRRVIPLDSKATSYGNCWFGRVRKNKMKGRFPLSSILFYGITTLMVAVCLASFIKALSWINKPFPGFLIYKFPRVGSMSRGDWPGVKAGLKVLDKIIAVNGQPIKEGKDLVAIARERGPGEPIHYNVESEGRIRRVTIPTTIFTFYDFFMIFLMPFLGGFGLFFLGFIVYILKPNIPTSWVFFFFCLTMSIYMVTGFEIQSTYVFIQPHYLIIPLGGAIFFHLGLIFPEKKTLLISYPLSKYLIYLPAIVLALAYEPFIFTSSVISNLSTLPWIPDIKTTTVFTRIFAFSCVIGVIILVFHSMAKTSSSLVRQRAKMIIFGATIGWFLPGILMILVLFVKINFPWNFLVFLVIFFPLAIAYSIVRHNLFDADAIIKRTMGYVIVTAVIVGTYVLVSISLNVFLEQYQVAQSSTFPIIFTLVIILIFNPLRNRIQSLVDRLFFRKEYDYGEIVHRIGGAMASLLDLGQILRQLISTFMKDMFIDTSSVMLLSPTGTGYHVFLADGERKNEVEQVTLLRDQPLLQIIEKEKKEITKYDVLEDPKYSAVCEDCARDFDSLHASLMVPLVFQDQVIGLINLGEKKSGKFYNREDIDLLRIIANQGAVAIQNAKLLEQMKAEEAVRTNLARYLSPQIVDQVIKKNVEVNLGGDRKVVTVLFSDIRNFTRISESLPPDKLIHLLNEYFTEMAKIIFENQGSLDKYIGDAIVAVFGSLIPLENPGRTAIQAAVQMMKELSSINERWMNQYGFRMDIGIGINTGEVFLGNIGSPERMEFTVIGDTVNIASRFSDIAKAGQILITKETLAGLTPDIEYKELPPTEVKGKTGKLKVFEIVY